MLFLTTRLFHGGTIRPLDPAGPAVAEALLVEGERIIAVGKYDELRALSPAAEKVDLEGRCLLPGFIDAHFHLVWLGEARLELDLGPAKSRLEAVEIVDRAVAAHRDERSAIAADGWIMGRRWNQENWADRLPPEAACLDAVTGERPVYLVRVDGHAAWVNKAALRRAGVTEDTPDPPGGHLVRDARGRLTGELVDHAMDLVKRRLPPADPSRARDAILAAQSACFENGITSVHDMFVDREAHDALASLDREGLLQLEVRGYAGGEEAIERLLAEPRQEPRDFSQAGRPPRFTMQGVKLFSDGALGSHGAALDEPYSDRPCEHGLQLLSESQMVDITQRALTFGWQVATHAIGDRAARTTLAAYRRALAEHPGIPHRLRLEHAQMVPDAVLSEMSRLGILASIQPVHAYSDCRMARARLGMKRLGQAYPWRRLIGAGLRLAGGSDAPVEDPSTLAGLTAALVRNPPGEEGLDLAECLTLDEALALFTRDAAWAGHQEGRKGRLAPGLDADLVILEEDPYRVDPAAIARIRVSETWADGRRKKNPSFVV